MIRLFRQNPRVGHVVQTLGAAGVIQVCLVGSGIVIARSLGPAGRGETAVVLALPPIVMQIVCVGFPSAVTYYIARQRDSWVLICRRVAVAAMLQTLLGIVLLLGLSACFLAGKPGSAFDAGLITLTSIPPVIFLYYTIHIVQGLGDIRWFNALRIGSSAVYSGGILIAAFGGLTVERTAIIYTATQYLLSLVAVADLRRRYRRQAAPSVEVTRQTPSSRTIGRFAMAGFLAQVSPIESFRLDTLAVAVLFPSRIVGYYAVANSVTNVPIFAADALSAVGYPHIAAKSGPSALASTRRYMRLAGLLCGSAALVTAVAIPLLVPTVFGAAYRPSIGTGEFLAAAAAVLGLRRIGNDFLRALGRPSVSTKLEIVTIVLLLVCFATLGQWGTGRGIALSLILSAGAGLVLFQRALREAPQDLATIRLQSIPPSDHGERDGS